MSQSYFEPDTEIDETGTWLSIGDLMSALLMIFALILIIALFQLREFAEKQDNTRVLIIQALTQSLADAGIKAEIDPQSGDISVLDSVLFEYGSSELKPEGYDFLDRFIPLYGEVIFTNPDIAAEVQYIVVEGHTSSDGSYAFNMNLALQRADSVLQAIVKIPFAGKDEMLKRMLVSGRGEIDADQQLDLPKDRKVVFRFQFTTDRFLRWFDQNIGAGG